jgi:hypothetical protein
MDFEHIFDELALARFTESVFRLANPPQAPQAYHSLGMTSQQIVDIYAFQARNESANRDELLNAPFRHNSSFTPSATRFSDGSRRVFYSALESATAEAERIHWFVKATRVDGPSSIYLHLFQSRLDAAGFDIRPKVEDWPFLTGEAEDYPKCQNVAAVSVRRGAQALLCPSARRKDGTTVPVFSRQALSGARIIEALSIEIDADGTPSVSRAAVDDS